jgi:prevent-host-death family protein
MLVSNINEAKANLSQLINRALAGDEIIIARSNQPLARIVPYEADSRPRVGGQWAGRLAIGENFEFTEDELASLFDAPILRNLP